MRQRTDLRYKGRHGSDRHSEGIGVTSDQETFSPLPAGVLLDAHFVSGLLLLLLVFLRRLHDTHTPQRNDLLVLFFLVRVALQFPSLLPTLPHVLRFVAYSRSLYQRSG